MKGPARKYQSPVALRRALTDRLRQRALASGEDLQRLYRLVAFDRVLARLFRDGSAGPWVLKGGCALEIRYRLSARTTVDLDLALPVTEGFGQSHAEIVANVWDRLASETERDLGDGFDVRILAPKQEFTAPPKGGVRFPVAVRLGGKRFANFHLDVGFGDANRRTQFCSPPPVVISATCSPFIQRSAPSVFAGFGGRRSIPIQSDPRAAGTP